jgi:hypothetical protein
MWAFLCNKAAVFGDVIKGTLPSVAVFTATELGQLTMQVTLLTGYVNFGTVHQTTDVANKYRSVLSFEYCSCNTRKCAK